jgi:hypothetical protein
MRVRGQAATTEEQFPAISAYALERVLEGG